MRKKLPSIIARLPLRWRLALASFGLLTVLLTAMGFIISYTAEQALLANQANAFITEVGLAVQATGTFTISKPQGSPITVSFSTTGQKGANVNLKQKLGALIDDVLRRTGQIATAVVISPEGYPFGTDKMFPKKPSTTLAPLRESDIQNLLNAHNKYALVYNIRGQREILMLLPIFVENHPLGLLALHAPTTETDTAIEAIRVILLLAVLSVLLLAAALTLPVINLGLRPLVEIERTSQQIAHGALSLRLKEPGARDEIGRLARSFNHMVERLESMFARQKRFVADVSHELRTPLTALGGSLEMLLLEAESGDPAARRRLLRGMYAETERMQRMVADLLALARLDEGQMQVRCEQIDVTALIQEVAAQGQLIAQGQQLSSHIEESLPAVHGDRDHLKRILLNLVENALKFTPPEKAVEIHADSDVSGGIWIEVRDTGCGIPPEALPHIFERFYRADPARARSNGHASGNGLGLAIARSLIEAQHGTIEITSEVGTGTVVRIALPQ